MEKTIWTPDLYGHCDFGVHLDHDFALKMVQAKISTEKQMKMGTLAKTTLKRLGGDWPTPYLFYEDSCLVMQFSLCENGVLLTTTRDDIEDLLNSKKPPVPVEYHSHNVDTPKQAYTLMALVNKWVEYADAFKKT